MLHLSGCGRCMSRELDRMSLFLFLLVFGRSCCLPIADEFFSVKRAVIDTATFAVNVAVVTFASAVLMRHLLERGFLAGERGGGASGFVADAVFGGHLFHPSLLYK